MLYEIHAHTNLVDGRNTPEEMVDAAVAKGLDGIAITDHDVVGGNERAQKHAGGRIEVIPGVELSSREGHILCLGTIDLPSDVVGTPFLENKESAADLVDLIHDAGGIAVAAHPYDRFREGVGDLIYELPFDAIEVLNGHTISNTKNPRKAAQKAGKPATGGSDAHKTSEVGNIVMEANDDILSAIKCGRANIKSVSRLRLAHDFARSGILREYFKL